MKRVVSRLEPQNVVSVSATEITKVYASVAFGHVYKLHCICGRWMFCSCGSSGCGAAGSWNTMFGAIIENMNCGFDVYEFDTAKEFFQWAIESQK
jgi:hypothetical protein